MFIRAVSPLVFLCLPWAALTAQDSPSPIPGRLNLVTVEGDGAINNIKQRASRQTIVQVEDENHKPVAGAAVVFLLPDSGPGGAFAGGAKSAAIVTDSSGRAVMPQLQLNHLAGKFQVHITASANGQQATATISQSNAATAGGSASSSAATHGALSGKAIGIIVGVAAAGAVGAAVGLHGKPGPTQPPQPPSVPAGAIAGAGNVSFGPPR